MMNGSISSAFTFEDLNKQNVSIQDLFSWSAPIDLAEHYQIYIEKSNSSLISGTFYNYTLPWFGVFCQYTFDSNSAFQNIVKDTFQAKSRRPFKDQYIWPNITKLTCYVHMECNRGPAPICLDCREICDGQIDCIESGIDEMNCLELEINFCVWGWTTRQYRTALKYTTW
jgi:hypothetical protein